MSRRFFLGASLGVGLAAGVSIPIARAAQQWQERVLHGFGTTLWLQASHAETAKLTTALDAVVRGIRDIESQMSLFDAQSELCRLNRVGYLANPSEHLRAVLSLAKSVASASDGAFDPTIQPVWQLWNMAHKEGRLPSTDELREKQKLVDWHGIHIDTSEVRLERAGMQLSLNGIAQGYAADYAKQVLLSHGIQNALINTGEWSMFGRSSANEKWSLALDGEAQLGAVLKELILPGDSIATSSDRQSTFTDDRRFHHILDPKTAVSPSEMATVCVIAPSCALADALTKVFFMKDLEQGEIMARQWNVKVVLINKTGKMRVVA
jgi:FAD:protein FMN transferase